MNTTYCSDIDLHRWEPALAAEAAAAAQTLLTAEGTLHRDQLTLDLDADIAIRVGQILVITAGVAPNAVYQITAVEQIGNEALLALARFKTSLDQRGVHDIDEPIAVSVAVRTFVAQRIIVSEMLRWMSGVDASSPATDRSIIGSDLRKPCALGALHLIYAGLHVSARRNDADLIIRSELYARLYRQALKGAAVEVDADDDGVADFRRSLTPLAPFPHF